MSEDLDKSPSPKLDPVIVEDAEGEVDSEDEQPKNNRFSNLSLMGSQSAITKVKPSNLMPEP